VSDDVDATRRTHLAVERTYLAWWRTGLTAYAVALATARVVPDLAHSKVQWPYTILGAGFAVLGSACALYGERRRRVGVTDDADPAITGALAAVGALLGVALVVIIAVEP
jgi:putative membrane protein